MENHLSLMHILKEKVLQTLLNPLYQILKLQVLKHLE